VFDCYEKAKKLLQDHKFILEALSVSLLEKEFLTKDEFESMMQDLLPKK
jgi:ATP-dependent Zn protease